MRNPQDPKEQLAAMIDTLTPEEATHLLDCYYEFHVGGPALRELAESLRRLDADLKTAAATMGPQEARYMVDAYYQMQEARKRIGNQIGSLKRQGFEEPHTLLDWTFYSTRFFERQIYSVMDIWTDGRTVGRWVKSLYGFGPVISAGLASHIDITKAPTVGAIWRFAGLDPSEQWLGSDRAEALVRELCGGIGWNSDPVHDDLVFAAAARTNRKFNFLVVQAVDPTLGYVTRKSLHKLLAKRPWNADLKTLCWKTGNCIMKFHNNPKSFYGPIYRERKAKEQYENEQGENADRASTALASKRFGTGTEAYRWYSQGKLPPAEIENRAERYATKLFLAHWHHVAYEDYYGVPPPKPYVLTHLQHGHIIAPPNWPLNGH